MAEFESGPEQAEPALNVASRDGEPGERSESGSAGGVGDVPAAGPARSARRNRQGSPAEEETRGRKLSLSDSIHLRLWLSAQERRTTVSAIASEILDRHLPRFRVERE